jgi:thiol-disulfide isomerase/thioredoxin
MHTTLHLLLGMWRAVLTLPGADLPFNYEMKNDDGKYVMIIHNAEERIIADEVTIAGDSLFIKLPVFDSEFRLKVSDSTMEGYWINYSRKGNPAISFKGVSGIDKRFLASQKPKADVTGRWEAYTDITDKDSSLAIGVFKQEKNHVKGTFLSAGGDHRYLEGAVTNDTLWLSTFDGSHCWLYCGIINKDKIDGTFWSGNHYQSAWHAKRNEKITLPDPVALAKVKSRPDFAFPDADSNIVSTNDERFHNKAIIIQILGTWCPNCLDETKFLVENYQALLEKNIEVIGLAFERTAEFSIASNNIKRLAKRLNVKYPILLAGVVGKEEVMNKIKGLQNFSSYPTSIYINKRGEVIEVYTGFSGPATGEEYEKFKKDFYRTIDKMSAN